MAPRLELQMVFEALLGSEAVYFQPPASLTMQYPCIVYQRDNAITEFADNDPYRFVQRYQVTVIDRDPDTVIRAKVAALRSCLYNRFFAANNLNHDVFILYF